MPRRAVLLSLVCMCAVGLMAQDLENIQIHGFATQGFLISSNNNYLTMQSRSGSAQCIEGAVKVSDAVTDEHRVGMQLSTGDMHCGNRIPQKTASRRPGSH